MSSTLEAAEALLATIEAGRARIRSLAHRSLPFDRALDLEVQARVGASPERVLLEASYAPFELARLTFAFSAMRPSGLQAPVEQAAPAEAPAPVEAPAPTEAPAVDAHSPDIGLEELIRDDLEPAGTLKEAGDRPEEAADALEEPPEPPAPAPSPAPPDSGWRLEEAPSSAAFTPPQDDLDEETLLRTPVLPRRPIEEPATEDDDDIEGLDQFYDNSDEELVRWRTDSDGPDEERDEEEDTAVVRAEDELDEELEDRPGFDTDFESEPTTIAPMPAELRALTAPPRAVAPVVAPSSFQRDLDLDLEEEDDRTSPRMTPRPAAPPVAPDPEDRWRDDRGAYDEAAQARPVEEEEVEATAIGGIEPFRPLQLIENDSLDETTAAAVQILGVGRARTLTPTLELGDAGDSDQPEIPDPADPEAGGFRVVFEEPEEPSRVTPIHRLTDVAEQELRSPAVLTPDGLHHQDGPAVADAKVSEDVLRQYLAEAQVAEERGNLQQAVLLYGDLLSLVPSHVGAHLRRGRCLVELGDYAAAMSDFQRAEDLSPSSPDPIVEMGNLFFARKEYRKAISYFDQAVEMAPDNAMAWCRRGICHHYRKNHAQAFKDLQKAISLDPDIPNLRRYVQMARKAMDRSDR